MQRVRAEQYAMSLFGTLFGPALPSLDARQAQARLGRKPGPYVLDVRQPEEYAGGHIAGAQLIPLADLPRRVNELPRDREIICICRSGSRSSAAVRQLTGAGFKAVNLAGGMLGWVHAGLPVKRGP